MTDEELSELAECLEDACQERIAHGGIIAPAEDGGTCCPLGALVHRGFPLGQSVAAAVDIPAHIASSFIRGFDGWPRVDMEPRAYALGVSFRERYAT